jgi:hypothetical protein
MSCPSCEGKKFTLALVDGPKYRGPMKIPCMRCGGVGEVDDRQADGLARASGAGALPAMKACASARSDSGFRPRRFRQWKPDARTRRHWRA